MNNDPPSPIADPPQHATSILPDASSSTETEPASSQLDMADMRGRVDDQRRKKRGELLDDLLRTLDILIYGELSTVYYLDCSMFRFLLRAMVQLAYLSPKPPLFPEVKHRPYIGAIVGTNFLCFFLHLILARPEAGEASRGYLHGGLLIDFVGQEGPTSKIRLVILDLLTLLLQVIMLSIHLQRQDLKESPTSQGEASGSGSAESAAERHVGPGQDHDAEERGVLRSDGQLPDDIELPSRAPPQSESAAIAEDNEEVERLLAEPRSTPPLDPAEHPLDMYYSGEAILATACVWDTVRDQFWEYEHRATDGTGGSTSANSSAAMAAALTGGRLGIRVRIGRTDLGRL